VPFGARERAKPYAGVVVCASAGRTAPSLEVRPSFGPRSSGRPVAGIPSPLSPPATPYSAAVAKATFAEKELAATPISSPVRAARVSASLGGRQGSPMCRGPKSYAIYIYIYIPIRALHSYTLFLFRYCSYVRLTIHHSFSPHPLLAGMTCFCSRWFKYPSALSVWSLNLECGLLTKRARFRSDDTELTCGYGAYNNVDCALKGIQIGDAAR